MLNSLLANVSVIVGLKIESTSGERAFGTGWEGPLVPVVATGTMKLGLKVFHVAWIVCWG
jgi:hypothetical protein